MSHDDLEISCPAMEIWTTIVNEYLERKKNNAEKNRINKVNVENPNYIVDIHENLIKVLL